MDLDRKTSRVPRIPGTVSLTDHQRTQFLSAVRIQLDLQTAAYYAAIPYDYLVWIATQADLPEDDPNGDAAREFMGSIVQTQSAGKASMLLKLYSSEDPKWSAWILERKFPEEFGRTVNLLTGARERTLTNLEKRLEAVREAESADDVD